MFLATCSDTVLVRACFHMVGVPTTARKNSFRKDRTAANPSCRMVP